MDVSRCFANSFTSGAQKRDDIVVGFAFDFLHALEVAGCSSDSFDRPLGDAAATIPRFADRELNSQPDLQLVIVTPHRPHFGPGVPADHERNVLSE